MTIMQGDIKKLEQCICVRLCLSKILKCKIRKAIESKLNLTGRISQRLDILVVDLVDRILEGLTPIICP